MYTNRRAFLKGTSGAGLFALLAAAGVLKPGEVRADVWNKAAFATKNLEDLVKVLGGGNPAASEAVTIDAPDIAENGAVVPLGVTSTLSNVQSIAILVEKNPNVLAANFEIPEGTLPEIQTRVKMAETSKVIALVKADGKMFYAVREIKVTLGGCGG